MRIWISLVCIIIAITVSSTAVQVRADSEPTPINSTITHVTVYPEWAYVTRRAEVTLSPGVTRLSLEQLPSWIDGDSIRAHIGGADMVTILNVSTQTTYLARSTEEQVNKAESAVTQLRDRIEDLSDELVVLKEEREYLTELRVYSLEKTPKDAAIRKVPVEELAQTQSYLKEQRLENVQATTKLRRQIRDIKPELAAAEKTWNQLKGRVRLEQKRIILEVKAAQRVKTSVEISYLISGASWYPVYDARTSSSNAKIELTCQAIVQQSTGENWSNATFVLSTIQPYLSREKPELKPWYVGTAAGLEQALSNKAGLSGANFRYGNPSSIARLAKVQGMQIAFNTINAEAAEAFSRVVSNRNNLFRVIRKIEERGTTVEFTIVGNHSVSADGKPASMPIGHTTLEATRQYSAAPAVSKSTYITGKMRHAGAFPILPGHVNIYTDGSFTAKSELPFVAQNENFELFLGLEERIKVARELDYSKSSSSNWSRNKRLSAAYIIIVKNFLDRDVTIDISDQVPVSQNKEIVVKLESTKPSTTSFDKGILTWPVTLAPGESKTLRFAFRIDYPPSAQLMAVESLLEQIKAQ